MPEELPPEVLNPFRCWQTVCDAPDCLIGDTDIVAYNFGLMHNAQCIASKEGLYNVRCFQSVRHAMLPINIFSTG